MSEKIETFFVNVNIIEGRHLAWPNMDSAVHVHVGNQKKCTGIRYGTDCPYFNEFFVFEFLTGLQNLIDKNITFTIIQPRNIWRSKKILGYINLDVATVWTQPDHQFYHKWAVVTSANDSTTGPRGYIKIDIYVLRKGESPKIPLGDIQENDEIEGNLLLPEGVSTERQRANFIFKIYRGENVNKIKPANAGKKQPEAPNSFIEINFVGLKAKTSIQKGTSNPTWNERLVLSELFPPLCQRIKIYLRYADALHNSIHAVKHLNLSSISNDGENGFLPNFGPAFIHFYHKTNCGEVYAGKVLLSITTEVQGNVISNIQTVSVEPIPPLNETTILKHEPVLLFAAVFGVSKIDKKYGDKNINFELSFGHESIQKVIDGSGEGIPKNSTAVELTQTTNKIYWHLAYENQKPCMTISSIWPDFRRRMYNSNMIGKIVSKLKNKLDEIEILFANEEYRSPSQKIEDSFTEMLDFLTSACSKYIDLTSANNVTGNNLDKERINLCLIEMTEIKHLCKNIYNSRTKKKSFRRAQKLYKRLEILIEDPQSCWPDIYIWMLSNGKRVAFYKTTARDLVFSIIDEEAGPMCSNLQTIFFQSNCRRKQKFFARSDIVCKMDVCFWIGLERHKSYCYDMFLPTGYKLIKTSSDNMLPSYLITEENYIFQCRAHIYQGRFNPGSDGSGLCDPFIRITIDKYSRETKIQKATLNPVWDQTLLIKRIILYGSKEFIKLNPPTIIIEVFDQDECCKTEYIGYTTTKPVIKLIVDPYTAPLFPPKLKWYKILEEEGTAGEILAAIELLEVSGKISDEDLKSQEEIIPIPPDIKPSLVHYRIELLFWGVRELKKANLLPITKPQIAIECSNALLHSDILLNSKKNLNFTQPNKYVDVLLPNQHEYASPVTLKMYDCRSFGRYTFAGTHIVPMQQLIFHPLAKKDRQKMLAGVGIKSYDSFDSKQSSNTKLSLTNIKNNVKSVEVETEVSEKLWKRLWKKICKNKKQVKVAEKNKSSIETKDIMNEEDFDWWSKYYASLESDYDEINKAEKNHKINKLKIYQNELEAQPEFKGFTDILTSFHLYKGKRTGDETVDEDNVTGIFKGSIKIYRWPPEHDLEYVIASGLSLKNGVFQDFPSNEPLKYVVRVYCIKAIGLTPKDLSGKSDPYICITMNDIFINDEKNYISKQVNPIFGRSFELCGSFPRDHTITVAVWDWDMATSNDLIGETKIDLENRMYTRHRATCGLPSKYKENGYCAWRDNNKPTQILESLCKKCNLRPPEYTENSVEIGFKEFRVEVGSSVSSDLNPEWNREITALAALRRWNEIPVVGCHLVPEHVETRSIYHPAKPGIEQGKLQLWIDIFPYTDLPPPKAIDISPRKPVAYELRVIIWNTDDVILQEDDFFLGEKRSDIYVKGWLVSPDNSQSTDVHYRSLSGEGNFNWRFIFRFEYISTENKLVFRKKETLFSIDETEYKIPCRLTLQVWDNDTFSADDFLGQVILDLSRLPRGSKTSAKCSLLPEDAPKINLFKTKRTRGWWPFRGVDEETKKEILGGKVEVEFQLVLAEEADKDPVGMGRGEPHPLPKPNRPDTSFSWFRNPLKALKYVICKHYRWKIIKTIICILLIFVILIGIYAFPGYTVKRLLGA